MEGKKSGEARSAPTAAAVPDAATLPPPPPRPPPTETLTEAPRRRGPGAKRKAAAAVTSAPSKRLSKERNPVHQQLAPQSFHNGPVTRARQIPKLQNVIAELQNPMPEKASPTVLARVVGGEVGRKAGPAAAEVEEEGLVDEAAVEAEFEAIRMRGATAHVVPTHAGWFSWNSIHPLEKHTLTTFFNGKSKSRTPEIYMEIRNAVMKKFHADPGTQLEAKDLDELTAGDLDARREVMEFLDHWGLINFHPFPPSNSDLAVPESNYNDSTITTQTLDMIDKLYHFEAVQSCISSPPKKPLATPAAVPSFLPESIIVDELFKAEGPSVEYHCNSCSADCSRKRYHCQTQADFDLCTECYNNGKFDSGMAPTDFILMEFAEVPGVSGGNWTDQETLLLLEALELFGENWNEIAEHVATKTKAQCILHFLQMPIEDSFFDDENNADNDNITNADCPTNQESSLTFPEPKATGNGDSKSAGDNDDVKDSEDERKKDHTENKETRRNIDEAVSHSIVYSKNTNAEAQVSCDPSDDSAINILRSAFEAVGCLPEQGELLSFAEAGNPVMALAAFLAGLVGSNTALASTRSSLKALAEESPSIHLAARHCFLLEDPPFLLEDPPNDNNPPAESATNNMESVEADKKEGQTGTYNCSKEVEHPCVKHDGDAVSVVKEKDSSEAAEECLQEQALPNSSEDVNAKKTTNVEANGFLLPEIRPIKEVDAGNSDLPKVRKSNSGKVSGDAVSAMEIDQANKVEEVLQEKLAREEKSNPAQAVSKQTGEGQSSDTRNAVDSVRGLAHPEESGFHQRAALESLTDCKKNGDGGKQSQSSNNEEGCSAKEVANNHGINRIRRAAVTALSAAAVKAKLLAKDEEEQILQLVSLAVEKQLYKLETKISFLSDIDNVLGRVREQTEKARQRLFQERAQIIAARLGLPASSARGNLPNKLPMGYSGIRPPYLASQKPPSSRKP